MVSKSYFTHCRSSRRELFCKKGVLRNLAKFTGKHLWQSLQTRKSLRPATLLKKRLWRRCFPVNFAKFRRTPFLIEHLRWLLLTLEFLKIVFSSMGNANLQLQIIRLSYYQIVQKSKYCVFYMLSTSKFSFEIPLDILFPVIAYLINFAQKNYQNSRSLNVWLA